jgi:hypothetical protein
MQACLSLKVTAVCELQNTWVNLQNDDANQSHNHGPATLKYPPTSNCHGFSNQNACALPSKVRASPMPHYFILAAFQTLTYLGPAFAVSRHQSACLAPSLTLTYLGPAFAVSRPQSACLAPSYRCALLAATYHPQDRGMTTSCTSLSRQEGVRCST